MLKEPIRKYQTARIIRPKLLPGTNYAGRGAARGLPKIGHRVLVPTRGRNWARGAMTRQAGGTVGSESRWVIVPRSERGPNDRSRCDAFRSLDDDRMRRDQVGSDGLPIGCRWLAPQMTWSHEQTFDQGAATGTNTYDAQRPTFR
jgi:hypothetical protein